MLAYRLNLIPKSCTWVYTRINVKYACQEITMYLISNQHLINRVHIDRQLSYAHTQYFQFLHLDDTNWNQLNDDFEHATNFPWCHTLNGSNPNWSNINTIRRICHEFSFANRIAICAKHHFYSIYTWWTAYQCCSRMTPAVSVNRTTSISTIISPSEVVQNKKRVCMCIVCVMCVVCGVCACL